MKRMDTDKSLKVEASLEEIRHLLSHLHGEITVLEESYTQVLQVLRKFEEIAEIDDLTGLLRRKAFFRRWEAILAACEKMNEDCGVILVDIDHFKRINDTHGHPTGDEVLKKVAGLLKSFESPNVVVSRLGGEEFAIAVRGSDAEVLGVAEMIRRGAERLHGPVVGKTPGNSSAVASVEWKCTLSAGTASARKEGFVASALLKSADEALYRAKNSGRNQVCAA